jgi:hypothetical protein
MVLLGSAGTFLYDHVAGKVEFITGVPRKTFKSLPGMIGCFRNYINMAPANGWPTWPITAFWWTFSAALLSALLLFACLNHPSSWRR